MFTRLKELIHITRLLGKLRVILPIQSAYIQPLIDSINCFGGQAGGLGVTSMCGLSYFTPSNAVIFNVGRFIMTHCHNAQWRLSF